MAEPLVVGTPVLLLRGVGRHEGVVAQVLGTRGLMIDWSDGLSSMVSPQDVGSLDRYDPEEEKEDYGLAVSE